MKRRDVERALRANGCSPIRNTGGHEVWGCPCGAHIAPLPRHNAISAGVVRNVEKLMACLPDGWLQ